MLVLMMLLISFRIIMMIMLFKELRKFSIVNSNYFLTLRLSEYTNLPASAAFHIRNGWCQGSEDRRELLCAGQRMDTISSKRLGED